VREYVVCRTVTAFLVPFIQIFALYVIAHGTSSAGGGFQGGVILATSFLMLAIIYGAAEVRRRFSEKVRTFFTAAGLSIFLGVGLAAVLFGGEFLAYGAIPLPLDHAAINHSMIELVEAGIGLGVMGAITSIALDLIGDGKKGAIGR